MITFLAIYSSLLRDIDVYAFGRLNGYTDATSMRLAPYESANFTQEVAAAWRQLEPLYREIHAYVRHKLAKK